MKVWEKIMLYPIGLCYWIADSAKKTGNFIGRKAKPAIAMLVAVTMMLSVMPLTSITAFAAGTDTGKAIQLVNSGTAANIGGGQADSIYFGTYKQSSDGDSGYNVAPIKWRVLSNADGKLFLLSDQNLDVFEYHKEDESVTWETSTMRSWLNGLAANQGNGDDAIDYAGNNFLDTAFSAEEQAAIADTTVVNDDTGYEAEGGNNTTDKVFLLSIAEASNTSYFADNNSRIATNTAYVAGGGEIGADDTYAVGAADYWWLRSPGSKQADAAGVISGGGVDVSGFTVSSSSIAVRPAFNLNLESVLFTSAADNSGHISRFGTALPDYSGSEWKLTLKDGNDFSTDAAINATKTYAGGKLEITHKALSSFVNAAYTDVTAMLQDAEGKILYYGSIDTNVTATKTILTIPTDIAVGDYVLSVYAEDWNGAYATDYATSIPFTTTISIRHIHPVCGATCTHDTDATTEGVQAAHTAVAWEPITSASELAAMVNGKSYYLGEDITVSSSISISGTVNLCLNGHTISAAGGYFDVAGTGTLNLCSCKENGIIKRTTTTNALISADAGATANLYNVTLDGNKESQTGNSLIVIEKGTVTLGSGAVLTNNKSASIKGIGSAVTVTEGTLNINGGKITNNVAYSDGGSTIKTYYGSTVNMTAGEISGNSGAKHGGAIQLYGATESSTATEKQTVFNMSGGTISGNSCSGVGGGVAVSRKALFNMTGGTITDNSCGTSGKGGGVAFSESASNNIEMSVSGNVVISGNKKGSNDNNLEIGTDNTLTVGTMGSSANVGVTRSSGTGVFTNGGADYVDKGYFTSDKPAYIVAADENNLKLAYPALTGVSAEGYSGSYDGNAHGITVTVPDGATVEYGTTEGVYHAVRPTYTNAGSYTVYYKVTKDGFEPVIGSAVVSISKAPLTVTAKNHTITYGDAPANDGVSYSGFVNGETVSALDVSALSYSYDYTRYGNKGSYNITPSGVASDNYTITYTEGVLTVQPKEIGISWTKTTLTYNGSAQKPTATATGVVNNDEVTLTVSGEQTNVGTHTATVSAISNSNYKLPDAKATSFTISAKSLTNPTLTLDVSSFIYDGSAKTPTVTVKDGDTVLAEGTDYTVSYSGNENAGTGKVTVTFQGNYSGSAETTFEIEKAASSYTERPVAKKDLVYNSGEQPLVNAGSSSTGEVQYALGTNGSSAPTSGWSTSVPRGQNAGTYYVWYKVIGDSNHNDVAPACVEVTIKKQQIAKPAADSSTFTYNGSYQTYAMNRDPAFTIYNNVQKNAGSYTVTVTLKNTANYEWTDGTTAVLEYTFKIEQKELGIAWSNTTLTYNGAAQQPTATATGVVNGDVLTLTVTGAQMNASADAYTATVTAITGEKAENYKLPTAVTTQFTIAKATPTYTAPTGLTATYGDTLANVSLPSGWTWKTPSASVGNAGVNSFKAVFTPDDTDNYDTVEIDVIVTVGKADASYTTPSGLTATYGDTLANVSLPSGWTWKNASASVGNVGINSFKAVYTPSDTDNFNAAEVDVSVTVGKANSSYTEPTAKELVYNGSAQTLVNAGSTTTGAMQYALGSITEPTGSWSATLPQGQNAGTYYVWYKVIGDDNHNDVAPACVTVTIAKKQIAKPAADNSTFTYNGSYQTYAMNRDPAFTIYNNVQKNAGSYTVTVTLQDTANYEWTDGTTAVLEYTFKIEQKELGIAWSNTTLTYNGAAQQPTATATGVVNGDVLTLTVTGAQMNASADAYTATVTAITGEKAENYKLPTAVTTQFTIAKATPTYTVPANLTATYGQTLVNVSLPHGWSWVNDSQSVGAVGTKSFDATFTPSDTVNYKTVEVKLTVTVGKATPVVAAPTAQNSITYGAKLNTVGLTDGWTWVDGNTVPTVQNTGFKAYYTPSDTSNYDWTQVEGWNAENNRVERTVSVTVNKQKVTMPTENTATFTYTGTAQTYMETASALYEISNETQTNAGSYTVIVALKDSANYAWADGSTDNLTFTFTIAPKAVTVKADAKSMVYGASEPALTYVATGLVAGETLNGEITRAAGTDVGTYAITQGTVTDEKNPNYAITFVGADFTISKANQEGFAITGKPIVDIAYGGSFTLSTADGSGDGAVSWEVTAGDAYAEIDSTGKVTIKGVGTVTITATKAESANYNVASDAYTFTSVKATPDLGTVAVSGTVYDTTSPSAVVLTKTGSVAGEFEITDNAMLANKAVYSYTFTPDDTTNYNTVTGTVQIDVKDTQVPSATIKVDTKEWKEKLNGITFGIFFKNSQTVTITYADNENGSGVNEMLYFVADKELTETELAAVEWNTYSSDFNINPDGKFVIYAKVSDNDGNDVTVNSNGIVLDETQAVIEGVTNGGIYYGNVTITVSDALAGVKEVKVDGAAVTLSDGKYTIEADNAEHTVLVTDNADNTTTTYTITVYKQYTVTYVADGQTVSEQTVNHGADATVPAIPAKEGYTQVAPYWDGDGTNITADTVINAVYTINTYTVTYVIDGEVVDTQTVEHGTKIAEPTAPTKDKANFAGWFSDIGCTMVWNFDNDTVTGDLTLYAKWSEVTVFQISGTVKQLTGNSNETTAVGGATVKLMLGDKLIATTTTDGNGNYSFAKQEAGHYNVVVTNGAQTVTVLIELTKDTANEVVLPASVTNSIVKHEPAGNGKDSVAAGTLVGNLDKVAAAVRGENPSAQKVEVKLTVADQTPVVGTPAAGSDAAKQQAQQKAIQQKAPGKQMVFFDLSVMQSVTDAEGKEESGAITNTGETLLEIRIPFDSGNKWGITIYRYHDNKAETLTAVNKDSQTEGYWVGDDGYIHIYTHKFSTYAVGYTVPSYGYFVPITPDTVTSADTFDAGIVVYVAMSMLAATGSAVVIGKKRKEEN